MALYVCLLRGINVGGAHKLPMAQLKEVLAGLGCADVQTYIQSGNAVFSCTRKDAAGLAADIAKAIGKVAGFEPHVLVLPAAEFAQAAKGNPYKQAEDDPKSLHLFFLDKKPDAPDLDGLMALKAGSEDFHLSDKVFYLSAPDGIGRSKLAAKAEKLLGVPATARNWRSVQALRDMAGV